MRELQTFRFVDRDKSDTLDLITLDGLVTNRFLPLLEEKGYHRRLVQSSHRQSLTLTEEIVEMVEKGTDIRTLTFEMRESEDEIQPFYQFIERHLSQFCR